MLPLILVSCHSVYMVTAGNNCIGGTAESRFPEYDPLNRTARRRAVFAIASIWCTAADY